MSENCQGAKFEDPSATSLRTRKLNSWRSTAHLLS